MSIRNLKDDHKKNLGFASATRKAETSRILLADNDIKP